MKRTTRKTGVHTGLNDKIGADRRCPIGQLMIGINDQNMSQTKMGPKKIAKKLMQPNQTMGNAALKKHVATAEKTGVLNLSRSKLDEFPEEVMRLKGNLRSLDLAYNKFSSLTPAIGDFSSMKSLVLDHNSLSSLPQEIGKLIKLETLSVVGNKLKTLPNSLENCGNLKQVQLQNNQLKEFPVMLCGLKHLDLLDLSTNQVTSIPKEASRLHVTELNLNQNRLDDIAPEIARAPRLKTLRVQENCLTISGIPTAILTDSCVSTLAVEGNLFDMRQFTHLEGYDQYQERFTAVKKKLS
uniref:Leucine-rich repeat-containing protein 57 n=2 Tax=Lygus hesperus TaxID=30085 RepID=A0A0A9YM46_LYGHE